MTIDRTPAADPILAMVPEVLGRRVLEPCVLYARLGRGGMGAVYLAKHLTLLQKQVVKCLWLMGSGGPGHGSFVERFQQEARIAAAMTHQNLVRVTHVDRLGELHYLVMEYVEGEDLDRRLQRLGPLSEEAALTALLGAAQGLGYAHARGIVHRDIKPANLMISTHGEVKVIDLGLARAMDTTRQFGATVGTLGTPPYMPPEQWQDPAIGPSGDVWALGAVLHFMLTGRSPVAPDAADLGTIREAASDPRLGERVVAELRLSRAVRRVLLRCLAFDPGQRYADARELAAELAALVPGDELLLATDAAIELAAGDEPSDDELHRIDRELAARAAGPAATVLDAGPIPDQTVMMPGNGEAATAAAEPGDTLAMPGLARTVVPQPPTATSTPTPTPTPRPLPLRPLSTARLAASRRRRTGVAVAVGLAAMALVAAVGVTIWPRTDYAAMQGQAMAAIYQERFAAAEQLLLQLEQAPAFADQARRLRIDVLVKSAERVAPQQPVVALQRLAAAVEVAQQLLIARDTDDALQRIDAAEQAPRAAIAAALAAALELQSPLPGTVVTTGRHDIAARFDSGPLGLRATIQERPLRADDDGTFRGEWTAPAADGAAVVEVVVEEPVTGMRHVVAVPVAVKRGAIALRLEAPTGPVRAIAPELTAVVDNGPLAVQCTLTLPGGESRELELGEHDGRFTIALPLGDAADGTCELRLHARSGEAVITSPTCELTIDRTAPSLRLEPATRWTAAPTLLLRGTASERCRIFAGDDDALAVSTDATLAFALPVALPQAEGRSVIRIGVRDAAGNEDLAAFELEVAIDRTAPTIAADALRHPPATAADRIVIAGRLDEPGFVHAGEGEPKATDDAARFEVEAVLAAGEIEQPTTIRLVAHDRAGNVAAPRAVNVFVDRRGPRILPGAPDGSWFADDHWCLRIEDRSQPCRVEIDGRPIEIGADGLLRIERRPHGDDVVVHAQDALGNASTRTLAASSAGDARDATPPGPTWGTAVAESAIDPELRLHERVAVRIGEATIVLRLVRPLRPEELPPPRQRDAQAIAMLQEMKPFYLAETELPVATWRQGGGEDGAPAADTENYRFDPKTCQWAKGAAADWRQPLHPDFTLAVPTAERERWPVTQITAAAARAFCARHDLRLPTAAEWLAVVRMGSRDRYGWLPAGPLEQRANLADLRLTALAPRLAAFDAVDDGYAALAPVDALPKDGQAHPWGFRNLLGNAAEWCVTAGDRAAAFGGSWLSEPRQLRVTDSMAEATITSGAWDCVGFRVARDL
ncbi:MAG: protein kinase [Planctomycetes bacterium]|nr:protein kinase [Planctomycetota bacterium]